MAERRPNVLLLALLGIVGLALVAIVVSATGGDGDGDTAAGVAETRDLEVVGDDLPLLPETGADPAVGLAAPVLDGATFAGDAITIPADGPALVIFAAHWCPHCRSEVPFIVDWLDVNGAPAGVELFAVSTGVDPAAPNYPPSKWLDDEGWPIPTLADADDNGAARAYGVTGYPFFVAVAADGTVAARGSGELDATGLEAMLAAARG